jgi:hypothetical protein
MVLRGSADCFVQRRAVGGDNHDAVGRNYAAAMRLSREGIRQRSDFVGAHRVLVASAALRRAQPNISLAWIASQMPIKQDATRSTILKLSAVPAWLS